MEYSADRASWIQSPSQRTMKQWLEDKINGARKDSRWASTCDTGEPANNKRDAPLLEARVGDGVAWIVVLELDLNVQVSEQISPTRSG